MHIAILPMINHTNNGDGPIIVRAFVARKLGYELGFIVPRLDDTDATLASRDLIWAGHPVGTQLLSKQDPAVLASWLGVDGIMFGELNAYSKENISLYSESSVKVHFWLTDVNGKKIWESSHESGGSGLGSGSASMANILSDGSLSPDVQDRIRRSDVAPTGADAVDAAFLDFPTH